MRRLSFQVEGISPQAIKLLNENNKNVILTDTYGYPISFINGMMESLTGTLYRIAQYDAFRNSEICEKLSKQVIQQKILHSRQYRLKMDENREVKSRLLFLVFALSI